MHHFHYENGLLKAERIDLTALAAEVGTPFYCYSTATLERHYRLFAEAVGAPRHKVFFAMKANGNLSVLRTLGRLGAGADTVSEGEIRKAMVAGISASLIVFSGVGKTEPELAFAVDAGVYQINIETEGELEALARIASARGRRQPAVIRVNPGVGAGGHEKITTGGAANKFGVSFDDVPRLYARAADLPGVEMLGLAVHIGSQITSLGDLEAAFRRMRDLTLSLRAAGHAVERLDLGGGLGIPYEMPNGFEHGPDLIHAYAAMVEQVLGHLDVERAFEPGRIIVGNAGVLVARVVTLNSRPDKEFAVLDAAMNDLIRPAMYGAYHEVWPLRQASGEAGRQCYDVVGPVCESSDTFAVARELSPLAVGDLVAFMTAGAYGAVMSSTYNARLLVPEVLVNGGEYAVVRPRPSYADLIALDRTAPWLAD